MENGISVFVEPSLLNVLENCLVAKKKTTTIPTLIKKLKIKTSNNLIKQKLLNLMIISSFLSIFVNICKKFIPFNVYLRCQIKYECMHLVSIVGNENNFSVNV